MIISLVNQKGGVSKSTLAASIAWELHARGFRTLLVDADPQQTVCDAGAAAASNGISAPTIIQMKANLHKPEQIPRLSENFDHVIIDTPGRSGDVQNSALMASDVALIPIGQSAAELWALSPTLDVVKKATELKEMLGHELRSVVVVTRKAPRTSLGKAVRKTLTDSGLQLLKTETTQRVSWQECLGAGQGVAQYAPRDPAAAELRAIVDELLTLTGAALRPTTSPKLEVAHG